MLNIGNSKIGKLYLGNTIITKAYLGNELVFQNKSSRLPKGYTELEYIETSKNVRINTGIKVNSYKTRVVFDALFLDSIGNVFGSIPGMSGGYFHVTRNTLSTLDYRFWTSNSTSININLTNKRVLIDWDLTSRVLKIDSAQYRPASATMESVYSNPIYLCYAGDFSAGMDIYSCQIYESGILLRDFVPCSDPNGQIGMFDLVESQFYGSAGTGVFTAGPAV